jgi:hypothetical protein
VTWTRRDYTDLKRLLKKCKRDYKLPDYRFEDGANVEIDMAIQWLSIFGDAPDGRVLRERRILHNLGRWCELIKDRYGMKRFTAIKWLMQQYYDKEGQNAFSRKFGAGVDSVARRLSEKAKHYKGSWVHEAAFREAGGGVDIYELTFKILKLWPEPGHVREMSNSVMAVWQKLFAATQAVARAPKDLPEHEFDALSDMRLDILDEAVALDTPGGNFLAHLRWIGEDLTAGVVRFAAARDGVTLP